MESLNFYQAVYAVVRAIPHGKVATYGQIAALLGSPRAARAVGYALASLRDDPEDDVPWQRVINAQGTISARGDFVRAELQRRWLEQEGVSFDAEGKVSLAQFRWAAEELPFQLENRVESPLEPRGGQSGGTER